MAKCELPEGTFSLLLGSGREIGQALVADPRIKAVGFTGSRSGGTALMATAQARPEPIPVSAEMSSINPVFLLPKALKARATKIAEDFVASLNIGAGQFCTNPGLLVGLKGPDLDAFVATAGEAVKASPAQTMLTPAIHDAYQSGVVALTSSINVKEIARGQIDEAPHSCQTVLFTASANDFLSNEALQDEVFGAASLVIECLDSDEMQRVAEQLEGQLTPTLQLDDGDLTAAKRLLPVFERRAGRIIVNGWPTEVKVGPVIFNPVAQMAALKQPFYYARFPALSLG